MCMGGRVRVCASPAASNAEVRGRACAFAAQAHKRCNAEGLETKTKRGEGAGGRLPTLGNSRGGGDKHQIQVAVGYRPNKPQGRFTAGLQARRNLPNQWRRYSVGARRGQPLRRLAGWTWESALQTGAAGSSSEACQELSVIVKLRYCVLTQQNAQTEPPRRAGRRARQAHMQSLSLAAAATSSCHRDSR
jgi:hypothetical protein